MISRTTLLLPPSLSPVLLVLLLLLSPPLLLATAGGEGEDDPPPCPKGCACTPPPTPTPAAVDAAAAAAEEEHLDDEDDVPQPPPPSTPTPGWSVRCRERFVDQLEPALLARRITDLDLSGNLIETITGSEFSGLESLQKLSLRNNGIQWIEARAFENLTELRILDLAQNELRILNLNVFEGLDKLEKLNLSENRIGGLSEGVFDPLYSLMTIDLASNLLVCDCHLKWAPRWARKKKVSFSPGTTCHLPAKMKGKSLKKSKRKEFHCNWPVQPLTFEMTPAVNQVVFQGDQLTFRCHLDHAEKADVYWFHNGQEITSKMNRSNAMVNYIMQSSGGDSIISSLRVSPLGLEHTGIWGCQVPMLKGNNSRSVNILVISEDAKHCPQTATFNNKGRYSWPKTVVGITAELPCASQHLSSSSNMPAQATYFCNTQGVWENLNTSLCPYISEVTKLLEQFSKTNLSISSRAGVVESARRLRNYTGNGSILQDKMDVVFISRTVENYLEYISWQKEMGEILIDIVSTVMRLDKNLLADAQKEDRACSRLIQAIEKIPELLTDGALNRYRDNIAVEEFIVKPNSFSGMSCTSYVRAAISTSRNLDISYNEKVFECNTVDVGNVRNTVHDKVIEASIQLPASLFQQLDFQDADNSGTQKLQFTIYRNSGLFPVNNNVHLKQNEIITSIISSQMAKMTATNLTDPVVIRLRTPVLTDIIVPVWWDFTANDNYGDWSDEGCKIRTTYDNLVVFQCNRLANFGLLQDADELALYHAKRQGAIFRLSHPAIYVGSSVCIVCLLAVILIYLCFYRYIKMPKRAIHSLVNTWFALILLCFLFCAGVYQTENPRACQAVGLLLHYFTLCSLFWMIITVSNMYKKLTKQEPPEAPLEEPLPPKPMLRFYLVGWGIAIIICGISAAVNMEEYAGYYYCFLAFGPSVGAFYGPAAALVFFLCVFFCLVHCVINSLEGSAERPNVAPPLDTLGQELVAAAAAAAAAANNPTADVRSVTSTNMDDLEHPPILQLRAHAVVLLLFLLTWASAAIATAQPFAEHFSHGEAIFACMYGWLSSVLGVFILIFFCHSRQDIRGCLTRLRQCRRRREVYDTASAAPPLTAINGHVRQSTHSLESSFTNKSSHTSRSCEGGAKGGPGFFPNTNFAMAPQLMDPTAPGAEVFYNPRQNGIARRFFEKNRQQKLKLTQYNNILKTDRDIKPMGSEQNCATTFRSELEHYSSASGSSKKNVNVGGPGGSYALLKVHLQPSDGQTSVQKADEKQINSLHSKESNQDFLLTTIADECAAMPEIYYGSNDDKSSKTATLPKMSDLFFIRNDSLLDDSDHRTKLKRSKERRPARNSDGGLQESDVQIKEIGLGIAGVYDNVDVCNSLNNARPSVENGTANLKIAAWDGHINSSGNPLCFPCVHENNSYQPKKYRRSTTNMNKNNSRVSDEVCLTRSFSAGENLSNASARGETDNSSFDDDVICLNQEDNGKLKKETSV